MGQPGDGTGPRSIASPLAREAPRQVGPPRTLPPLDEC